MATSATPRPLSVSIFGWLVVLGSVFIVVSAFEQISSLSSLDSRERVQEFLAEPPGNGLGLSVETTLDVLHVLSVITGGCAAAAAVLGVYVLRRSRSARVGLTVVAVPMFVAGLALGGILTAMVAAGAVAMWLQPARDWFNGVSSPRPTDGSPFGRADREERGSGGSGGPSGGPPGGWSGGGAGPGAGPDPTGQPGHDSTPGGERAPGHHGAPGHQGAGEGQVGPDDRDAPGGRDDRDDPDGEREHTRSGLREAQPAAHGAGRPGPRAYVGFGEPGAAPADESGATGQHDRPQQAPWPSGQQPVHQQQAPWQYPPPGGHQQPTGAAGWGRPQRPAAVLAAAVLTWAVCAAVGMVMVATIAMLAAAPDALMDEVLRQNPELAGQVGQSTLVGVTIGVGVVIALWCVAASVAAFFVVRGQPWARVALAVSAVVAALGCLLLSVGSVAMLIPAAAAGATAYLLLLRPDVRAWFRRA